MPEPLVLDHAAYSAHLDEVEAWRSRMEACDYEDHVADLPPSPPLVWSCSECPEQVFPNHARVLRHIEFRHGAGARWWLGGRRFRPLVQRGT